MFAKRFCNSVISIHALLAESDANVNVDIIVTPYFYPRSPCGERPPRGGFCYLDNIISIHALLAESDLIDTSKDVIKTANFYPRSPCGERRIKVSILFTLPEFLSTLSLRRATTWTRGSRITYVISIHALLAESDQPTTSRDDKNNIFLSTLSLRRATDVNNPVFAVTSISIHALLAESDL